MKNFSIILVAFVFFMQQAAAQKSIALFSVDNTNYLQLNQFTDGSILEQYSQFSGGQLLGTVKCVNKLSTLTLSNQTVPKMLLNRKNSSNPNGDNQVYFITEKEFAINNIELKNTSDNKKEITWEAVCNTNDLMFSILKNTGTSNFKSIGVVNALQSQVSMQYRFCVGSDDFSTYKLAVLNSTNVQRYISTELGSESKSKITVYPTYSIDNINIDLSKNSLDATCQIFNAMGELLQNNKLDNLHNSISIYNCNSGNLFVKVSNCGLTETFKIVKQ